MFAYISSFCSRAVAFEVFEVNIAFAWYIAMWFFSGVQVMSGWGASRAGVKLACRRFGVSFGSYEEC